MAGLQKVAKVRPHHGTWLALNVWTAANQNTRPRKAWTPNLNAAILNQLHLSFVNVCGWTAGVYLLTLYVSSLLTL